MQWHILNWVVLLLYLGALVVMGFMFSSHNKTSKDYFVGGQRIPAWAAAVSLYATALSSISYIAITSSVYRVGWVFAMGVVGIIPLLFLVSKFFVPFIRRINATTAYEYLEARFHRPMRLMASLVFMVFHVMRIAIVVFIPTLAFQEALPGVSPLLLVAIMGFLCVIYTTVGGFEAVIWSDVVQTFVLFGGAILIAMIGFSVVPSGVNPFATLAADGKMFGEGVFGFNPKDVTIWWLFMGGFFGSIYQYIGSQDVVQRYSSTKSLKAAQRTVLINAPLLIVSIVMFILMGSALYLFYKYSGVVAPQLENMNAILPYFVVHQVPMGISGLIIAGIFAAAQSTVSSSLNSTATCAIVDFVQPMCPDLNEKQKLFFAQLASWSAGILGTLVAMSFVVNGQGDMYTLFNAIIGLLGAPVAGIFLLGIFCRKAGIVAAWIGFGVSAALSVYLGNPAKILSWIPGYEQPQIFPFLFAFIILFVSVVVGFLASMFTSNPGEEKLKGLTYTSLGDLSDIQ
ncbi:MAG: sodium:solute symporter [Spirochaetia bacterium]